MASLWYLYFAWYILTVSEVDLGLGELLVLSDVSLNNEMVLIELKRFDIWSCFWKGTTYEALREYSLIKYEPHQIKMI